MALAPNENITPGTVLRDILGSSGGNAKSLAHPGFTYTIVKTVEANGAATYTAFRSDGSTASSSTDSTSPIRSGLKAVLTAIAADNTSIYFPSGFYSFPEDPAGAEDHWAANGFKRLALEGDPSMGAILANWRDDSQGGYDTNPDVEPFSMTRCDDLVYRNFRVWAGGNQDANNSSDACDFDSCRGTKLENIVVERSRARGIVYDGGDSGAVSRYGHIRHCEVRGVPVPPAVFKAASGVITAQEYRYVVTYVDSLYGETPPSEFTSYNAPANFRARLTVPTGPAYSTTKGVTARKIYRWSTAQPTYRLIATLDNSVLFYDDNATDASIAAAATLPTTGTPLIPKEGIKLLGCQRHSVMNNVVSGVGSHGIQVVRKGSTSADNKNSDDHRIIGNVVRHAGAGTSTASMAGIYVGGGSNNVVQGNIIENPGVPAALGNGIAVQGLVGATTAYNLIGPNIIVDDQTTSSPSGGPSMRYGVQINIAGAGTAPDNTVLSLGGVRGFVTGVLNDVGGTNTKQYTLA